MSGWRQSGGGRERALTRQREALGRWLAEWALEGALGGAAADPAADAGVGAGSAVVAPGVPAAGAPLWRGVGLEAAPAVGQIRLWAPEAGAAAVASPCFVAVLELAGDEARVAPFGRFSEPALTGEWRTGRKPAALRVLCLWNVRRVAVRCLALSWVVGSLAPRELQAAGQVLAHVEGGAALPGPLARRVGPPLRHPDDPRVVYRYREALRLERLLRGLNARYAVPQPQKELMKAAESPEVPPKPPGSPTEPGA